MKKKFNLFKIKLFVNSFILEYIYSKESKHRAYIYKKINVG